MQSADAFISLAIQSCCIVDQSNERNTQSAARAQQCKRHDVQRPQLDCINTYRLTAQEKRLLQEHVAALCATVPQGRGVRDQPDHILASQSCEQMAVLLVKQ